MTTMRRGAAIVFLVVLVLSGRAVAERPNIILFLVDDMGWQDTSVAFHDKPTPLNARYRTPNMERLAARGVRFRHAYAAAPVCTPTRTSIMTGRSPARSHITYWTLRKNTDTSKKHPSLRPPAWRMNGLQSDDTTLARLLQRAGYRTIHAGKAHFGAHDTSGADPTHLGFTVNIAGHASGGPASFYGTQNFSLDGRNGTDRGPSVWDVPGLDKYHGQDIFLTEALAIEADAALRDAVADAQPFFLHFAPYAVHAPIMANARYLDEFDDLDAKEAAYATMLRTMDAALGTLLDTLDELGIADDTIVLFSSDNGGLSAHARGAAPDGATKHTHNAPLRSGKGSAYEGGIRVPTIVHWPGVTDTATTCDVPIVSHDFFPTVLAWADVEVPHDHRSTMDGHSLVPLLRAEPEFDSDRVLGWHQPHQWGASGPGIHPFTAIRDGRWKLLYFHAGRRFEVYDVIADPGETTDLAPDRPDLVRRLATRMDAWIDDTGAQLSIDIATDAPIEHPGVIAARLTVPATLEPVPSHEDRAAAAGWRPGTNWTDQHDEIVAAVRDHRPRVVFIGDSITQSWGGPGRTCGRPAGAIFERTFGPMNAINAGISGDRTQHVQWRLDHSLLDGAADDASVVLMIGTNNLPHDDASSIAVGIDGIVDRILGRHPNMDVLLLGVPPRGQDPSGAMRIVGASCNTTLAARYADNARVQFLDPTPLLTTPDGTADPTRMAGDFVHLHPAGYETLAEAIRAMLVAR